MRNFFIIFALISFSNLTFSQKEKTIESKKWDVNNPHKDWNYKNFNLKTDEGTWMNLDIKINIYGHIFLATFGTHLNCCT